MWTLIKVGLKQFVGDYKMSLVGLLIVVTAMGLLYLRYDYQASIQTKVDQQVLVNDNVALTNGNKQLVNQIVVQAVVEEVKADVVARNHQSHTETSQEVQKRVERVYARPKDMTKVRLAEAQIDGLWSAWCATGQTTAEECVK